MKIKHQVEIVIFILTVIIMWGFIGPLMISYDEDFIVIAGIFLIIISVLAQGNWAIKIYNKVKNNNLNIKTKNKNEKH